MKRLILVTLVVGIVLLGACAAPSSVSKSTPSSTTTPITKTYIYIDGGIVVRGSGEPIELTNNPDATNPTFTELVAFIESDHTDEYPYIVGPPKNAFICSDFAETIHNNAEAAGLRAAWVGIDIEGETEGHALNAFQTTDLGLVYIDCTGKGLWDDSGNRSSWDRRAYVEIGQPYAVAALHREATKFEFFIYVGQGADQLGASMVYLEEQTLNTLEEMGWVHEEESEVRVQKSQELLEWVRQHDIEELGMKWTQEWIQEHEAELHGSEFELHEGSGGSSSWGSEYHVTQGTWYIKTDALGGFWFHPEQIFWCGTVEEKVIMVDEIPIVWQVTWHMDGWQKPFRIWSNNELVSRGVVEDIHIQWGE